MTSVLRRPLAATAALALACVITAMSATAAHAAATVDAVDPDGEHLVAAADAETVLTVTGMGFQSIPAGFGGIYVMFGTVSGDGWQPSAGGRSGVDYRYVNDDPEAPAGFQQFIAFPGGSTEADASGGTLSPEGEWQTTITVPGASLEVTDLTGAVSQLDCRVEQCGIITIGAHGVVNANNESFTPIAFEETVAPSPEPTMTTTTEPEPVATTPVAEESDDAGVPPAVLIGGAAVVLAAIAAAIVVAMRRRQRPDKP